MTDDAYKNAEQRGYAKGYVAGKRKGAANQRSDRIYNENRAFMDRVFLTALPMALEQQGWKRGEAPISSVDERVRLAWEIAESALKNRRYPR